MSIPDESAPEPVAPEAAPADAVAAEAPASPGQETSLWAHAVRRRVPQILGLYAGAATSAVLFVEFLVKRYALSPYLVDALLLLAVLAVPAVAALAYWHGAPGAQRWTNRQRLVLAGNGLVAVGALALAFWGKPLGATTETVSVETADGSTVERTIAKAAFRKRVVVSDFGGEEALGRAAGSALAVDLNQDLFVTAYGARSLRRSLRKAGFQTATQAPAALLRDAADAIGADALITGEVATLPQGYRLEARLVSTTGPSRPERFEAEGPDLPLLIDQVSSRIRQRLGLPETHLETTDDRPVEDILTGSTDALVAWAAGWHASDFDEDVEAAIEAFREAVRLDSTFAVANVSLGSSLFAVSRQQPAMQAFASAQRHRYRLTEPHRFGLDATLAVYEQRPDDALASVREWVALYPDDVQALETLSSLLRWADDPEGAIEAAQRLVTLDAANPVRRYSLAGLLQSEERYDEALAEVDAYIAAEPEEARGYARRSGILQQSGDLDGAIEAIRQAMRLDPNDARHTLSLGTFQLYAGDWDEAEATYRRGAARAAEPSDRVAALSGIAHLYEYQGRLREAAETLDEMWPLFAQYTPETQVLLRKVAEGYHYTQAGREDVFEATLAAVLARPEARESDAFRASVAMYAAYAYAQIDQSAPVLRYAATADSLVRAFGQNSLLPTIRAFRGLGHANAGDWDRAIRDLAPYVERSPSDAPRAVALAEVYLAAGRADEARDVAEAVLATFPANPGAHLVLARLDRERPREAHRHLEAALSAWADADAAFEPAQEARTLRRQLGPS